MLGVDGHATAQLPQIPSYEEQCQTSYLKFLTKGEAELVLEWVDVVAVAVVVKVVVLSHATKDCQLLWGIS